MASTGRARAAGALARLAERADGDGEALDALVFAYGRLSRSDRRALAQALACDVADPMVALAALLAVEEDAALRQRLAALLETRGQLDRIAWWRGTPTEGEACLEQCLGNRCETLRARWSASEIVCLSIEPSIGPRFCRKPGQDSARGLAQDPAQARAQVIDVLGPLLWSHLRKGGRLPDGADRFSGFFDR